jgi:1,4-alpha-glucan branching enzyme
MKNTNTIMVRDKMQKFSYATTGAHDVKLVGDFTNWQKQPIHLTRESNGVWQAAIRLEPGTYHYRFLVDGQWRDDPECPLHVPNPFGSHNAVRHVN